MPVRRPLPTEDKYSQSSLVSLLHLSLSVLMSSPDAFQVRDQYEASRNTPHLTEQRIIHPFPASQICMENVRSVSASNDRVQNSQGERHLLYKSCVEPPASIGIQEPPPQRVAEMQTLPSVFYNHHHYHDPSHTAHELQHLQTPISVDWHPQPNCIHPEHPLCLYDDKISPCNTCLAGDNTTHLSTPSHDRIHPLTFDSPSQAVPPEQLLTTAPDGTQISEWLSSDVDTILSKLQSPSTNVLSTPHEQSHPPLLITPNTTNPQTHPPTPPASLITPVETSLRSQLPNGSEPPFEELKKIVTCVFAMVDQNPADHWAKQFLMDHAPEFTVQMLVNPDTLPYAVTASISETMHEQGPTHGGLFDANMLVKSLYVPAFSVGDLTVGAYVSRMELQTGPPQAGVSRSPGLQDLMGSPGHKQQLSTSQPAQFSIGRYARHATSGRLLIVRDVKLSADDPPILSAVTFTDASAPARHQRVNMLCNRKAFLEGNILESVKLCMIWRDARFCVMCGASPNGACHCKHPIPKARHRFDFGPGVEYRRLFPGNFLGKCKVIINVGGSGSNTMMGIVPGAAPASGQNKYVRVGLMSNTCVHTYCRNDSEYEGIAAMLQAFAVQISISGSVRVPYNIALETRASAPTAIPRSQKSEKTAAVASRDEYLSKPLLGESCSPDEWSLTDFTAGLDGAPGTNRQRKRAIFRTDAVYPQNVSSDIPSDTLLPYNMNVGSKQSTGIVRTNMRSVPRSDSLVEERIVRELRRREKNREAAARSNARRKFINDSLKSSVAAARRTAEDLRLKEQRLREENLAMRRRINALRAEGRLNQIV